MPPFVKRQQSATNLVWLDLEMTGLDPERDVILQAAIVITTAALEPLEEFACDMHEKNGLLARVAASRTDLFSAEKQILERVAGWCTYPALLCGNTIGQDKRFIDRYMPGLSGYLSYRSIDVSSIKMLAKLWYGDAAMFAKPTDAEHDALFDVKQSVAELAHYRSTLFRK